ncbi:MAG: response regulator transcription factor [Prochloraceae cyanobacterium]|nr:response regulator transcription factor [Prochloraceae cyanobacterium]
MISLLIVDDQSLIRRGLKALLKLEDCLEIVGEADNGKTAIEQVEKLQPNVVLMDVRMPIMDGVAATKEISQRFPASKILVLTTFDDDDYVVRAIKYGASGYLLKDTPSEELVGAIQAVHKGYTQLGPGIVDKVVNNSSVSKPTPPPGWSELTSRELEILSSIAAGASNAEIAERLYISQKTVKNHVTNILRRLEVRDRTQAAILANSIWSK